MGNCKRLTFSISLPGALSQTGTDHRAFGRGYHAVAMEPRGKRTRDGYTVQVGMVGDKTTIGTLEKVGEKYGYQARDNDGLIVVDRFGKSVFAYQHDAATALLRATIETAALETSTDDTNDCPMCDGAGEWQEEHDGFLTHDYCRDCNGTGKSKYNPLDYVVIDDAVGIGAPSGLDTAAEPPTHAAIRATGNADAIAALDRHIARVAATRNSPDNEDANYEESATIDGIVSHGDGTFTLPEDWPAQLAAARERAELAHDAHTEPGPSAADTAVTICRTCGKNSPAHLSTRGQCIECWNDPELRGLDAENAQIVRDGRAMAACPRCGHPEHSCACPDGRVFSVDGDPENVCYPLLQDAQRRARTLWHQDAITFPATIASYDPDAEGIDYQTYHPGPFTYSDPMPTLAEGQKCTCGNYAERSGFDYCNARGETVEPDVNWPDLYRCNECSRIYRNASL